MNPVPVRLKLAVKQALFPVAFQFPPIVLAPERLRLWLDAVAATRGLDGDVIEVGCAFGGTAAYTSKFLDRTDDRRRYVAYDTFTGFVQDQFARDADGGTAATQETAFSANSLSLVRRVVGRHGGPRVRLVQGDVCDPAVVVPDRVSAALVDVDLEEPVRVALEKAYARLVPGGVLVVDDCDGQGSDWRADHGYLRFVEAHGLPDVRRDGMGLVGPPELLDRISRPPGPEAMP